MNILHTIPGLRLTAGGPPLSVSLTVLGLRDLKIDVDILSFSLSNPSDRNIIDDEFVHLLPPTKDKRFVYSPHFNTWLERNKKYDLYHGQAVWQYPSFAVARFARKSKKPYILTPRGMLYPQIFKNNPLVKKILWNFLLKNDLQKASCVHATCIEEMDHLRTRGITSPIAVIPNPVDVESLSKIQMKGKDAKFRVGYLGRIDPRKNIDRLIAAWAELGEQVDQGELVIMGAGDVTHETFLKAEVKRLGLKNVVFTGFISGQKKTDAITCLSYLVVPSDFENFGMIVAEALMYCVPVIASTGTPWEELVSHECGWWIANDKETIKSTLVEALQVAEPRRLQMGINGRSLITKNYSKNVIAEKVKVLYEWILEKGNLPDFVYLHNSAN